MRVLFVTLEFSAQPFSGNGIYSQSQVRALAKLGHEVLVVSGRPSEHGLPPDPCRASAIEEVALPTWGRVDRGSSFIAFEAGCRALAPRVAEFKPDVALGVDWTARRAVRALVANLSVPYVFLNYRVFLRSCLPDDAAFYEEEEREAAITADLTVVLCPSDVGFVQERLLKGHAKPSPKVLLPCLRADMAGLPLPHSPRSAQTALPERRYLTCCVRLSPEKEPERFVELVEALETGGHLRTFQVVPLLCASTATEYAVRLKQRFRAAAPSAKVEERFLGPKELAEIFAATLLNFHPPLSEAYGMTVVEAASQGAPSVVNTGDGVGATALLEPGVEVFQLDFKQPAAVVASQLAEMLKDPGRLASVGARAAAKSRSWSDTANAQSLVVMLQELM